MHSIYIVMDGHRPADRIWVFCWWLPAYWGYVHVGTLKYENLLTVCVCVFETEPFSPFHNPISPNVSQCLVFPSCLVEHLQKKDPKTKANAPDGTWILATWWFLCVPCPEVEESAYKADFSKSKGRQSCTGLLCPKSRFYKVPIWRISRNLLVGGGAFCLKCRFWAIFGFFGCSKQISSCLHIVYDYICASEMVYLLTRSSSSHEDRKRWMVLSQKSHAWPVQGLWQHSVALWRSLAEFKVLRTFFSHFCRSLSTKITEREMTKLQASNSPL